MTASGATPSTDELGTSVYEIKTIPVDNEVASALDSSLQSLRGNFFYSQFYFDDSIYKYKIIGDTWEWQVIGPTANVFTFQVERLFEPILDIALAYEINQSESVLRHFFRIATSSGTAVPSIVSKPYKTSTITTRPVSRTVAKTFRDAIASFVGATFYTKLYLDDTAKLYRIPSQGWSITGQGGDSCVFELNLEEVVDTSLDIPCSIDPLSSTVKNYGQKIKITSASGTATPSASGVTISEYEIATAPVSLAQASGVKSVLSALQGDFFFSKLPEDGAVVKYALVDNEWNQENSGRDAVNFRFRIRQVYEPTVEFAIEYSATKNQKIHKNFFKIATTSGSGAATITARTTKNCSVSTAPLSQASASGLNNVLTNLGGTVFYSKLYLDDTAKQYRLASPEWSITPISNDLCTVQFELEEVIANGGEIPCSIELVSSTRNSYGQRIRIAAASGNASPSASGIVIKEYAITTPLLAPSESSAINTYLTDLAGGFFYSKLFDDPVVAKYAIVDDQWNQDFNSADGSSFSFNIRQVYEPTIDFAINYGQSQEQQISAHIFRIATTSGTATPATTSRALKTASVQTRPMAKAAAAALETTLLGLNGAAFYSQIYLDSAPRLYRLQPYQWSWTPDGEDAYVCAFTMAEVIASATDIPCVYTLNLERTSRVKMVQFGDGYQQFAPDGINTEDYRYSIETLPLSDTQSAAMEAALSALKGNIFYAKFKNDSQVYKYRLDDNRWSWQSSGQNANVFTFTVKRAYDL